MKKLALAAALLAATSLTAHAQAPAANPGNPVPPAAATTPAVPGAAAPANPARVPDGFVEADATVRTAENLTGARVYDGQESRIGRVSDLVLSPADAVTHVVVDVGGFLGIGSHTVALPVDDVQVYWNTEDRQALVRVDMTREQLRDLPEFEG